MDYKYLGDRFTDEKYKGALCSAVRRKDGKCIRGKNGNMLVKFSSGEIVNIVGKSIKESKMNLGKKLHIGETFVTTTNRMTKNRNSCCKWNKEKNGPLITYEVLKPGSERIFTKGKRQYVCKVLAIVETKIGMHGWSVYGLDKVSKGLRWWQFSYLVKIIEN